MNKVLLLSDLDKTLLNDECKIQEKCLEAIKKFTSMGGYFSVCSGRPTRAIRIYSELMKYVNTPIISYDGACITDIEKNVRVWRKGIPYEVSKALEKILVEVPEVGILVLTGEDDYTVALRANEYTYEVSDRREGYTPDIKKLSQVPKDWNKVVITGPTKGCEKAKKIIDTIIPNLVNAEIAEGIFLEVVPLNINKSVGMKNLAEQYEFSIDNVIAIGDSINDYELLKSAGVGVAVANAEKKVLDAADFVVASNNDCGICECIEKYAIPKLEGRKLW